MQKYTADFNNFKPTFPLSIQVEITDYCNFSCQFCYNNSSKNAQYKDLDIKKWIEFIEQLKNEGGVFQFAFSGGEPLLFKDELISLMDILHNDNTGLQLITNGYLLDEEYVIKLKKYNWYWIQISLDSHIESVHDSLRGKNGAFERALKSIQYLKKHNLPTAISSVICSKNLYDIDGLAKLALENKVDVLIFSEVIPIGRASFDSETLLNTQEKEYYYFKINSIIENNSTKLLIRSAQPYEKQKQYLTSYPIGLLIRPNGDVKIDCISNIVVGNIFKTPIKTLWNEILESEVWKNEKNL